MNRYPLTLSDLADLAAPALVAVALFALPLVGLTMRAPDPAFTLLDFAPDGEVYAIDTGLTGADCERARLASVRALACEPET